MDLKRAKGITILALTVTIIILLILAGVTIGFALDDNGIIKGAISAKEQTEIDNEMSIVKRASTVAMIKSRDGTIEQTNLETALDDETGTGKTTVSKIRKKIVVEFNESKRMYSVDADGNVKQYEYKELAVMEDGETFNNRLTDYKDKILNVEVIDYVTVPENADVCFDVSEAQNGGVMTWLIKNSENNEYYDLYIGGDEGVQANSDCTGIFANIASCVYIDLDSFYTENTTSFKDMFLKDTLLERINLANVNSSKVTNMRAMFQECSNLKSLDLSNFETHELTDMYMMFF